MDGIHRRYGAYLPHWTKDGGTYSITFRQWDSIPASARESLRRMREEFAELLARPHSVATAIRAYRVFGEKSDELLNAGYGSCHMLNPAIADLVQDTLLHFQDERYRLWAWAVMPNHVHAVLTPLEGWPLYKIMHSWKSFTSHEIKKALRISETVWQPEYFDHLVRGPEDFDHCVRYVLDNPRKAGLKNWRWVGSSLGTPAQES